MTRLRTAFMGTPDFAVPALDALRAAGHEVALVYTRPPERAGRGRRQRRSPVHLRAEEAGIEVRHPADLRAAGVGAAIAALEADAVVVAAYGLLLPADVLEAPRLGCVNIHASLLPRWRGAAPIQRAILAGDDRSGITIMKMEAGLDTGPILAQRALAVTPETSAGELHDRLAELGAALLVPTLEAFADGRIAPRTQPADGATYARKIDRSETRIDWRRPASEIARQVRAFSPAPGAWFEIEGERIRVLAARTGEGAATPPGTVTDDGAAIACGIGTLRLDRLQRAGRGAMEAAAFLRGFPLRAGSRLGGAG